MNPHVAWPLLVILLGIVLTILAAIPREAPWPSEVVYEGEPGDGPEARP